jgi:hypothetical protein
MMSDDPKSIRRFYMLCLRGGNLWYNVKENSVKNGSKF